jgi:hypothetical protein
MSYEEEDSLAAVKALKRKSPSTFTTHKETHKESQYIYYT